MMQEFDRELCPRSVDGIILAEDDDDYDPRSYYKEKYSSKAENIDNNDLEDYASEVLISKTAGKRKNSPKVVPMQHKRNKKQKGRPPVVQFYEEVLDWTVSRILNGTRQSLGLPKLCPGSNFHKKSSYFSYMATIPIEEVRVSLLEGIKSINHSDSFPVEMKSCETFAGKLSLISLETDLSAMYDLKPGIVAIIYPNIAKNKAVDAMVEKGFLCTLYQGFISPSTASNNILHIWVSSSIKMDILMEQIEWKVVPIASVISYQRMYVACLEWSQSRFMDRLIGLKNPLHVKFDDDGIEYPRSGDNDDDLERKLNDLSPISRDGLNDSQKQALLNCLDKDRSMELIQGPPGCGKTHFLAHLLLEAAKTHSKVLVCAPSNKAVCVALEKFVNVVRLQSFYNKMSVLDDHSSDIMEDNNNGRVENCKNGIPWIQCALVGVEEKLENCLEKGPMFQYQQDTINVSRLKSIRGLETKQWIRSIFQTRDNAMIEKQVSTIAPLSLLPEYFLVLIDSFLHPSTAMDFFIFRFYDRLKEIFDCFVMIMQGLHDYFECDYYFRDHISLWNVIMNHLHDRFQEICDIAFYYAPDSFNGCCTGLYRQILTVLERLISFMASIQSNASIQMKKGNDSCSSHDCSPPTNEWMEAQQLTKDLVEKFQSFYDGFLKISSEKFAEESLLSSNIIFCTLASSGQSLVRRCLNGSIPLLIVDEAAQALEPELLIAVSLSPERLILIGDPQQLPATLLSVEGQQMGLGRSCMERLVEDCQVPMTCLNIQYRMHPEIAGYPNQQFYDQQLRNADEIEDRINPLFPWRHLSCPPTLLADDDGWTEHNLLMQGLELDHFEDLLSKLRSMKMAEKRSFSQRLQWLVTTPSMFPCWLHDYAFINIHGVEEVDRKFGKSICNRREAMAIGRILSMLHEDFGINIIKRIAVITFYSAQVRCIQETLRNQGIHGMRVMTVDSFQGSECEGIILSFVRSNNRHIVGFVNHFQRLNVAITRAKHLLLSVGCFETLTHRKNSHGLDHIRSFLLHSQQHGKYFEEEDIDCLSNLSNS